MALISTAAPLPLVGVPGGLAPLGPDGLLASAYVGRPAGAVPEAERWVRQGTAVLSAAAPWEQTAVFEPTVLYEGGLFKMWYTGGWDISAIGYATSTDGLTWTKHTANPVLGLGGSGYAGGTWRNSVIKRAGLFYCYFADGNPVANIQVATSADGINWTVHGAALSASAATWARGWANTQVVYDPQDHLWHMLVEGYQSSGLWAIGHSTSRDGLTFAPPSAPLSALAQGSGMYGGPYIPLERVGGVYQMWYHASTPASNLPTDIYRATSPDLVTWTTTPGPVLTHLGTGVEVDQAADPCVLEVRGVSYLYYAGMNNPASAGAIAVAAFGGGLADLVSGCGLPVRQASVTKTASSTLSPADSVTYVNAAGTTQTLPDAAACRGCICAIKNDASGSATTLAATAAQTIDGAATQTLAAAWNALTVQSTGAAWRILSKV